MDREDGTLKGETQQLILRCVAHVPGLGHRNLISAKALSETLDAPMRIYAAAAVIQPQHGGKSLIYINLWRDNGLFEIKAR